jgi:S1-C subfamily serine protease
MIRDTTTRLFAIIIAGSIGIQVAAQTPAPAPAPQVTKKPTVSTRVTPVIVENADVAPQIVTILHRLTGLKVIRQLLRYNEELGAIANLDEAFKITRDVHTNVIAGLALEDGETIAAWLPEASAEIPPPSIQYTPKPRTSSHTAPSATTPAQSPQPAMPPMPQMPAMHFPSVAGVGFAGNLIDAADLKVVTRDGKRLAGRYIGIDGLTGLSVIALSNSGLPPIVEPKNENILVGQHLRVLGPEPAPRPEPGTPRAMYFRVGQSDASVVAVNRSPSGALARIKVKANRLSAASMGSIAINDAGETVGIIDSVKGSEASIVPVSLVRSAAKRVLARQASVPRPWLGVRGEPIGAVSIDKIQGVGWNLVRAKELSEKRCGILLTSVIPGSPAARYKLKAGDVILSVNNEDIKNAEEFTWLLQEAGPGSSLTFTVARPETAVAEAFAIELSESPDPLFGRRMSMGQTVRAMEPASLMAQGIEAIAIKPKVAVRFGATGGLLVVYVQPATEAFKAGIRPGDVIQAIDGRQLTSLYGSTLLRNLGASSTFDIVRNKQKLTVTVSTTKPNAE